jgi:integrase
LTALSLDRPKLPATGHVIRWDPEVPGLSVRIYASGRQTFSLTYRVKGNPKAQRLDLGNWWAGAGDQRLSDIRAEARKIREQARAGLDPKLEALKQAAASEAAAARAEASIVNTVLDRYLQYDARARGLASAEEIARTFDRLVRPRMGKRSIYALRRGDVAAMLDEITDASGPRMADITLAYLRRAFRWHEKRDDDFTSPIISGMARLKPKERARERVLSDDELRDLWCALDSLPVGKGVPATFAPLVKALLLTAVRRSVLACMKWSQIERDDGNGLVWVIGSTKRVFHAVPLTGPVLHLLGKQGEEDYVFASRPGYPFGGFSKSKRALDKAIASIREKEERSPMERWTYHDLRRTARTLMSRAGVAADIAERVLGHVLQGVRHTYDRHHYLAEKRDALERLAALVDRIIRPPGDNVASLDERRTARP